MDGGTQRVAQQCLGCWRRLAVELLLRGEWQVNRQQGLGLVLHRRTPSFNHLTLVRPTDCERSSSVRRPAGAVIKALGQLKSEGLNCNCREPGVHGAPLPGCMQQPGCRTLPRLCTLCKLYMSPPICCMPPSALQLDPCISLDRLPNRALCRTLLPPCCRAA